MTNIPWDGCLGGTRFALQHKITLLLTQISRARLHDTFNTTILYMSICIHNDLTLMPHTQTCTNTQLPPPYLSVREPVGTTSLQGTSFLLLVTAVTALCTAGSH